MCISREEKNLLDSLSEEADIEVISLQRDAGKWRVHTVARANKWPVDRLMIEDCTDFYKRVMAE